MRFMVLGIAVLLCASVAAEQTAAERPRRVTLLHTSDIHGHALPWTGWEGELAGKRIGGFDRLASAVEAARAEVGRDNVLLLDSGDAIGDSMVAVASKGAAIVELMNAVGYDAMTLGNHEPDFGPDELRKRIAEAKFDVIAANVSAGDGRPFAKEYVIKNKGGVRVAVVGLGYPKTPLTTSRKNVEGLAFADPVEVARKLVSKVRAEGAELVVVLAHLGLSAEKDLAGKVPGIDVIVGGHSHNRMREPMRVGNTLIVQAGAHLSDLGRLDLTIANGRVVGSRRSLVTLDNAAVSAHAGVAAMQSRIAASVVANGGKAIATRAPQLVRAQTIAADEPEKRDRQSAADSLFGDLLRQATEAEIAMLPGVGYGTAVGPGTITEAGLRNLIPHDSKVVTLTLSGDQVREILEQSVENVYAADPAKKVGGIVQLSGLEFSFDAAKPHGNRVTSTRINGAPLEGSRKYRVVTNAMLAEGGHNYATFRSAADKQEKGGMFEMVRNALAARF